MPEDEDVARIMIEHEVDKGTAEATQELIDEGVEEEEDAIQIAEQL